MKLYATTSSERATKGQGGNDYLDINITNEHKHLLAYIRVTPRNNNVPIIYFTCISQHAQLVPDRGDFDAIENMHKKGNITCKCGNQFYGLQEKEDTCPQCLERIIKGKQKKGE